MPQQYSAAQIQKITRIQRSLGITRFEAALGTGTGVIFDPASGGAKVYVRFQTANTTGQPVSVRKPQLQTAMEDGTPVWVVFDEDDELAVRGPRIGAQLVAGDNPVINNVRSDPAGGFLDLSLALPLRSQPTPQPSLKVTVKSLWYMNGRTPVNFPGDGTVDLSSFIPASAGTQRLALVYLDTNDNAIHIAASTPINSAKGLAAFEKSDIEECVAAAGDTAIHSKFWQLVYGMTEIVTANSYLDFRHWLMPLNVGGSGGTVDLDARYLAIMYGD